MIFGFIFKGFLASKCNIDHYIWQKSFCELVLSEPQFLCAQPVFCKDSPGTCHHQLTFKNMKHNKTYAKNRQENQVLNMNFSFHFGSQKFFQKVVPHDLFSTFSPRHVQDASRHVQDASKMPPRRL